MIVLRREIGDVLRDARQRQGRTLREVSSSARVSLGYLSEVERGQKEASSELLGSICEALDLPLSLVLREVLGQAPPGYSDVTKTWCTEFEQRVADFCVSIAGPDAMIWGRTARNICYAPGYTIMGGTTQILRNIIGERILGLPR